MDYRDYTLKDLLADEFFVKWVKNPNSESRHFWEKWISENPDKISLLNKARAIVNGIGFNEVFVPSQSDYNESLEKILRQKSSLDSTLYEHTSNIWRRSAAVFITLIAFGFIFYVLSKSTYVASDSYSNAQDTTGLITKYNPLGQKIAFKLEDGTEVKLNSNTKLKFPASFSDINREVYLEGEAFFNVSKDENRPFLIHTGEVTTTVLGTAFNVKAYKDEENIQVALIEGKVKVNSLKQQDEAILLPAQMLNYSKEKGSVQVEAFDPLLITGWKDGILYFNRTSFEQVFETMAHWYGVDFVFVNNYKVQGNFTGTFKDKSLVEVLEGISFASKFKYKVDEDTIYIFKKNDAYDK
ncbi:MAG: FecR family protein [Cyclobacteriaceae bacterium]